MDDGMQSGILTGLERRLIFNRLRAAIGLHWELPRLLGMVDIPAESLCLEIGAGFAWGILGLIRYCGVTRVVATDYDVAVLPVARAYLDRHGITSRVALSQADARHLPFPDGTFDVVLALHVLHHVFGYRQALREIGRVTRSGGHFLFIDLVRPSWTPPLRKWVPPDGLPSRETFGRLLAEAGLQIKRWQRLLAWAFVVTRKVR